MSDPYEDLPSEQKEPLKREMKPRIPQRQRKEMFSWKTGALVALPGIAAMLYAFAVGSSPLAQALLVIGVLGTLVGLLLVRFRL